jgi:hypothetical protein
MATDSRFLASIFSFPADNIELYVVIRANRTIGIEF